MFLKRLSLLSLILFDLAALDQTFVGLNGGPPSSWNNPNAWTPNGVPTASTSCYALNQDVNLELDVDSSTITCSDLNFSNPNNGSYPPNINMGSGNVTSTLTLTGINTNNLIVLNGDFEGFNLNIIAQIDGNILIQPYDGPLLNDQSIGFDSCTFQSALGNNTANYTIAVDPATSFYLDSVNFFSNCNQVTISGEVDIYNGSNLVSETTNLVLQNATISAQVGDNPAPNIIGDNCSDIKIINSNIILNTSYLSRQATVTEFNGGQITLDAGSILGPTQLNMSSGNIANNGTMTLGLSSGTGFTQGSSSILGTGIIGSGNLYLVCDTNIQAPITQANIYIGEGIIGNSSILGISNISMQSVINANVFNGTLGTITGVGGINGNIVNYGKINSSTLTVGVSNTVPSYFDIVDSGQNFTALALNSSSIQSLGGVIGSASSLISFAPTGSLTQTQGASFGFGAQELIFIGGQLLSDASSFIGPSPCQMLQGSITNNGSMTMGELVAGSFAPSTSIMGTSSLTGEGTLYVAGNLTTNANMEIAQSNVIVGAGLNTLSSTITAPSVLTHFGNMTATVFVTNQGQLTGEGTLSGTITNNGSIYASYIVIGPQIPGLSSLTIDPAYPITNNNLIGLDSVLLSMSNANLTQNANSAFGDQAKVIQVTNSTITQTGGNFGNNAGQIGFTNSSLSQTNSSSLGDGSSLLNVINSTITSDATSLLGPIPLNMVSGYLQSDNIFTIGLVGQTGFVPSNSTISGGVINSLGTLNIAGNTAVLNAFSSSVMTIGQGYYENQTVSTPAILNAQATVTSEISVTSLGVVVGSNGLIIGSITNQGKINPTNLFIGSENVIAQTLSLSSLPLISEESAQVGVSSTSINIMNGSITSDNSSFGGGNSAQVISMRGGTFSNQGEATMAANTALFNLGGGYLQNIQSSQIGPVNLNMTGGQFLNNATLTLGTNANINSTVTGGSLTGSGVIQVLGNTYLNASITQSGVFIGSSNSMMSHSSLLKDSQNAPTQSTNITGQLFVNNTLNADVTVYPVGSLRGSGLVIGNTDVQGTLNPGVITNKGGVLTFEGTVTLEGNSTTDIWLAPNLKSSQVIVLGDLVANATPTLLIEKQAQTQYVGVQKFSDILVYLSTSTNLQSFNISSYYTCNLVQNILGYDVIVDFSSLQPGEYPGNAGVVAANLALLNGYCSLDLQDDIDVILRLNYQDQRQALLELCPQFKLLQYSLEKLLFTQEDIFSRKLSQFKEGLVPFVEAGFDQYAQKAINPIVLGYNQYHINSWTQNLGMTYGSKQGCMGFSLGAIESFFTFPSYPASARYKTLAGFVGYAGKKGGFEAVFDLFGSYSQIKSKRVIQQFETQAKTKHQAWNGAGSLDLGYKITYSDFSFKPYNKFGYIYGQENSFKEQGAGVLNLVLKPEKLQLWRNTLGLFSDYKTAFFESYLDLAWVYEDIISSLRYKGVFAGTTSPMNFYATPQRSNFAKAAINLTVKDKYFALSMMYQALMAKRFLEQTANLTFSRQF